MNSISLQLEPWEKDGTITGEDVQRAVSAWARIQTSAGHNITIPRCLPYDCKGHSIIFCWRKNEQELSCTISANGEMLWDYSDSTTFWRQSSSLTLENLPLLVIDALEAFKQLSADS